MKPLRLIPLIAGLLLALAPGSAGAVDGTITGLSFSPDPAKVGQEATITVLGTQKCKKVSIDFGDNTPAVVIDNPDFENNDTNDDSVAHTYAAAGDYAVTASAVEQCSGSAQKDLTVGTGGAVQVGPAAELLCKILDNCGGGVKLSPGIGKIALMMPQLEGIFPFSIIEPGGAVIVSGKNFGNTKGELHLFLKTDNKDVKIQVETWGNNGIGGKIPSYTVGVVDQPGEFYVKTASGAESNRKGPVSFTAKRSIKMLPRSAVELAFFGCGNDADCDSCLSWKDPDDGNCFSGGSPNGTVTGYHWQDCFQVGNDTGTDTYNLKSPLKNGWVLDKAYIHNFVDPGEGTASASVTSNQIKVNWSISPCDGIMYYADVVIKGPMATDY